MSRVMNPAVQSRPVFAPSGSGPSGAARTRTGRRTGLLMCVVGGTIGALAPSSRAQEMLTDRCFPDGTVLHAYARAPSDPWIPGQWNAETASIMSNDGPITPCDGPTMLRVNPAGGFASQVSQIIDVTAMSASIDTGMVILDASVQVNATIATSAPSVSVLAGASQTVVGTLNPVGGTTIQGYNRVSTAFTTDNLPATWETIRVCMAIPRGTRYLHFELAGVNASMPPQGVYYCCASVMLRSCNVIADGTFPGVTALHAYPRAPGNPWVPGEWNAEAATITGAVSGVTPLPPGAMLRINHTGGVVSQVSQIIDVSSFANAIDNGGILASCKCSFNAAAAGVQPRMFIRAGQSRTSVGTLVPSGGTPVLGVTDRVFAFNADANPASWQTLNGSLLLPAGTRYLHYELSAPNSTLPASGMFCDDATVCLRTVVNRFGIPHLPVGEATVAPSASGGVTVAHIGGTGNDGVEYDIARVWSSAVGIGTDINAASLPNGLVLRRSYSGTVSGVSDHPVFTQTVTDVGNRLEVNVDFSSIGATTQRIDVYNGDTLVASIPGHTGPAYRVAAMAAGTTFSGETGIGCCLGSTGQDGVRFAAPVMIEIVGGAAVSGTRVTVTGENPSLAVQVFDNGVLTASNIPTLEITSESVTPAANFSPVCPCDWNQSGHVNSQDMFDFLAGFFNADADYDLNGVTTSQDFFNFLSCFFVPTPGCE